MSCDRRRFLCQAAAGSLALVDVASGSANRAAEGQPKPTPGDGAALAIVDTHQHLWDLAKLRLPWLAAGDPLHRCFVVRDYVEASRGLGIDKAVYMEVDVDPAQHLAEAEAIVELCRRGDTPTCAAVIGGRPGEGGFSKSIRRFKGSPFVKGVRHIPRTTAIWRDKAFLGGIRLLGEMGMSFDLCAPPGELSAAVELVDRSPGTRFILDHCGNADPGWPLVPGADGTAEARRQADRWRGDIRRLADRKNVVCKISGIVARAAKGWTAGALAPVIRHCLSAFGPNRVMFGGDWPVCTKAASLRQWVEALKEVVRDRPADEQRKLFAENAIRFYGLKRPA
jgi:L-fuconolactonase